jgi:Aspartyl protease/PDZ domain
MIARILIIFLLLPLATLGQVPLGFNFKDGKSSVEFPIEIANNLVIVPIVLNGQLPLKFILDTGVRTTILTEKSYSDILKLEYVRRYLIAGPGGEKVVQAYITTNVSIDMPGIHGTGHAMLVLEEDYLELRNYLGTDVQGVLGYEVFSRFVVEINYEKRILKLSHPSKFKPSRKFQALPIIVEDTKPYIQAPIVMQDGTKISAKLMVDSGASHGLILDTSSDEKIKIPAKHISSLIGRGLGGVIMGEIGRLKSIHFGNYKIENPIASFPEAENYLDTLKATNAFRNGTVGGEVLSRFTTIYDYSGGKLYLKKNPAFSKKFYFNMSGLTVKAKGADLRKFEITDIRKGSSAEKAGVQNGDELISLDGALTFGMDLTEINGRFNSVPGRSCRLEVIRAGQRYVITINLEDPI